MASIRPLHLGPALVVLLSLTGMQCSNPPPAAVVPVPGSEPIREWQFTQLRVGATNDEPIGAAGHQEGGVVDEKVTLGPLVLVPPGFGPDATAEVFSNASGQTYWVSSQAPNGVVTVPGDRIGSGATLSQFLFFRKDSANATMRAVISKTFIEGIDGNSGLPTAVECTWRRPAEAFVKCRHVMQGSVNFHLEAFSFADQRYFFQTGAYAELNGWRGAWAFDTFTSHDSLSAVWNQDNFIFDNDVDDDDGGHAIIFLSDPVTIDVPLDSIAVGQTFMVSNTTTTTDINHRQRETYLASFFRDPVDTTGVTLTFEGATPIASLPLPPSPPPVEPIAACSSGTDPNAGTLQLSAATFEEPEWLTLGVPVQVTRTGGTTGAVSVLLTTNDGTAAAASDYTAVTTPVLFADGDAGPRFVRVPLVNDLVAEENKTFSVQLSDARGCAALGAQTAAEVTIMDDDRPVATTFTLGGTVAGLAGTGLSLRTTSAETVHPAGDGAFTFPTALNDGVNYDVTVETQPTNPVQICTVTNGSGTIAGADVADIAVDCVTPAQNGALDPTFGVGGRISSGLPPAKAIALQGDGKLLVVGGLKLSRYNVDGSIDTTFGTAGVVTVVAQGGGFDTMNAVGVQSDGKIVVAGFSATALLAQDDFALLRYNPDGTLDTTFGTAGLVITDFSGSTDRANALVVLDDDRLIAVGQATLTPATHADSDFALVKYNADGSLDTSFGAGGRVTTNIGGTGDFGAAAVVQPDGKILVTGRVAVDGGANPDFGVARYNADGGLDTTFSIDGLLSVDFNGGNWDEPTDLAVQDDGHIVVVGFTNAGGSFRFALMRLDAFGALDAGFGSNGLVSTAFTANNDFARAVGVNHGAIYVAGQVSNLANGDFGIALYGNDGSLDSFFGSNGLVRLDFFAAIDSAFDLLVQSDGKLVVVGSARNGVTTGFAAARVVP